jgi:hypothetical protein
MTFRILGSALVFGIVGAANAQTLSAMTSFGGGDGLRGAGEIITGDTSGTDSVTPGSYNYLGTASLERGMAYNAATGNLVLVSRSTAGNGIRVLNGTTGRDAGFLNQGTGIITGGTFTTNQVAIGGDGAIYVANLAATSQTTGLRIYKWGTETDAAPTVYSSVVTTGLAGAPRLGDSLDAFGSGANTRIVAGASGTVGYAIFDGTTATGVAPTGAGSGDFRLGITFGNSATNVLGKQTGGSAGAAPLRNSDGTTATGVTLLSGGEMAMDYANVGGVNYLATLDANSSLIRIYDMTVASAPVLVTSGQTTATSGLAANGNATGTIKFGAISGNTATIYAMSTNQGIQAMTFTAVPEPATMAALGLGVAAMLRRRNKKS